MVWNIDFTVSQSLSQRVAGWLAGKVDATQSSLTAAVYYISVLSAMFQRIQRRVLNYSVESTVHGTIETTID